MAEEFCFHEGRPDFQLCPFSHAMTAAEEAVGIYGYIGTHKGFSGLVKHRWEDFHVHEVSENGEIRHLTELISRPEVMNNMKSQKQLNSGEEVIGLDFYFDEETRRELIETGFFTLDDVKTVEKFIHYLAFVSDLATPKAQNTSSHQLTSENCPNEETEEGGQNGENESIPKLIRGQITVQSPPYCLILGDFERCLVSLTQQHINQQLPPPTLNQIWKELRRSVHCCIRSCLPFICSDTLTLSELSTLIGSLPGLLTRFYIPTEEPFISDNPSIEQLLKDFNSHVTNVLARHDSRTLGPESSNSSIDQFSRAIRLCPKPQCLFFLFNHLRRSKQQPLEGCNAGSLGIADGKIENTTISQQSLIPNDRLRCDCHKRKRKGGRWRQSQPHIGVDGICTICKSIGREPRLASHFERWPKDRPPYLYFHLLKSNRDTAEAINMIATCLGCKPKIFSMCGTKDRRAITVQAVTALKISIQQMHKALIHPKWDRNVSVSDLRYQYERIELGSLQGNHFRICLRNVDPDGEQLVKEACESLQQKGFINFFGLQRFGTRTIRTHQVGSAILKGDFKVAVRLILGDVTALDDIWKLVPKEQYEKIDNGCINKLNNERKRVRESGDDKATGDQKRLKSDTKMNESNEILQTDLSIDEQQTHLVKAEAFSQSPCALYFISGDASAALRALPRHCYIERQILKSLSEDGNNYLRALQQLPKNTLTLHVHAAQSVIWNAVVAHRFKHFGPTPVIGDFVFVSEGIRDKNNEELKEIEDQHQCDEQQENDGSVDENDYNEGLLAATQIQIRTLETPEDIAEASIFDIVLPVPGDSVKYPDYLLPIYQQASLEYMGLILDDIKTDRRHRLGDYSGGYRHICVQPKSVQYRFIPTVKNGTYKLLASDVDILLNNDIVERDLIRDPSFNPTIKVSATPRKQNDIESNDDVLTGTAAVLFCCTLPKSAYLTMACRELFIGNESSTKLTAS